MFKRSELAPHKAVPEPRRGEAVKRVARGDAASLGGEFGIKARAPGGAAEDRPLEVSRRGDEQLDVLAQGRFLKDDLV